MNNPSNTDTDESLEQPRAWMRRWYFDGVTPYKELNKNGRQEWPFKFKVLPITPNKVFNDDVPLFAKKN